MDVLLYGRHSTSKASILLEDFRSGIFVVLFFVAMHLLYHRKTPGRTTLLVLTAAMALLATTQFSLHIATTTLALRLLYMAVTGGRISPEHPTGVEKLYWSLVLAQDILLVTNTFGLFSNYFTPSLT
jgi:hypothetical protein